MSANVIFSFFKEYNVDYAFQKNKQKVLFPCLVCSSTIEMCASTTYWNCDSCNQNGNLLNLIKYFKDGNKLISKLYNPKTEQQLIRDKIKFLIKKHPTLVNDLVEIENRVMQLITHYKNAQ